MILKPEWTLRNCPKMTCCTSYTSITSPERLPVTGLCQLQTVHRVRWIVKPWQRVQSSSLIVISFNNQRTVIKMTLQLIVFMNPLLTVLLNINKLLYDPLEGTSMLSCYQVGVVCCCF